MATSSIIPERILRFLNALPVSGDPYVWVPKFRDELSLLLGDVDRVTISVNFGCDIQEPESYQPNVAIRKFNQEAVLDERVLVASNAREGSKSDQLLEDFRQQGYPLERYHPPHSFDYFLGPQAYLGTIFLWRETTHDPISQETLDTFQALQPFLIFALSDLVARRQRAEPDVRMFTEALQGLTETSGLSGQEQRVVILQLFGHSYKEMADMLGISVDGVKHHLKMIHKKTGARSYTELFAKYFTPRFDLKNNEGEPEQEIPLEQEVREERMIVPAARERGVDTFYSVEKTLGERMRRFGELAFGSVEEFAKALKLAPSNLQKYLSGERNPGLAMLQRLHELGCNVNSLISGEGNIFADNDIGRVLQSRFEPEEDAGGEPLPIIDEG